MRKRELVALLSLSSWCLVIDVWLFLGVPWVCLQFVILVFPDDTHLLFMGWWSDAYHPLVTVTLTLTSDLVSRNCIDSGAYLLYFLM